MKRAYKKITGQGVSEYMIIVGLVAIGAVAVVAAFGDTLRAQVGKFATALAGDTTNEATAETAVNEASARAGNTAGVTGSLTNTISTYENP